MRVATSLYLQFRHPSCRRASLAALALSACLCAAVEARAQDEELIEAEAPALPVTAPGEIPLGSVGGMGDVNLYPRRIVMGSSQRVASVGLFNRTTDPGDYEIGVADMMMTPQGQLVPVENLPPGTSTDRLRPASSFLRWSPRRVELLGSEAQTVRIMARPPADLPPGEYRTHFQVISIPRDTDDGFSIEQAVGVANNTGGNIGVVIRPRFGLSIPIIIRVGETTLQVALSDVQLTRADDGPHLAVTLNRSGNRSAYGDVEVTGPGFGGPIAVARGIGVYPEIDSRRVNLTFAEGFDQTRLRPGTRLTIRFIDDDVTPGDILAQQEFTVP